MAKLFSWKSLRILILLIVLLAVWNHTQLQKTLTTNWNTALDVVLFPINADGSDNTADYIDELQDKDIQPMQAFMSKQSQVYELWNDKPVKFRLNRSITNTPPLPPSNGSIFKTMLWSVKFRWWANKHKTDDDHFTQIRLYVLLYDPNTHDRLPHSTGMQKGLIGIVHGFAHKDYQVQNNVITVHEFLHTLGATDKYDLRTGLPIYPQGYAEPYKEPLHPQTRTEIMGGQRPVSELESKIPESFKNVMIGYMTAREIGWVEKDK